MRWNLIMRKRNGQHENNLYFQIEMQDWLCFYWNASKFKFTKREQGTGSRSQYGIYHMKQFILKFIGGVREYFANGFVLSLYQSWAHTKTLFSFFLFSSWQRKGSFVTVVVMRRILSNYWQGIIITFSRFLRIISKLVIIPPWLN